MSNIINHTAFTTYRSISKKYDEDKVEQSITQAHSDLREVLGDAFYFDVIKNQAKPEYTELLEGSEYTQDGLTYVHEGLKSLVADYTYARYLYEINVNHTPHGMVSKMSQDSQHVDRNMIKDLVKQTNIDASRKWELIRNYLQSKKDVFTVWAKQESGGIENQGGSFNQTRFTFLSTGKR